MEKIEKHDVNFAFKEAVRSRMNKLFKMHLTIVELESKKFKVQDKFFTNPIKKTPEGFALIRKSLLDHGNDLIRLMELIIDQTDMTPKNSILEIKKEKKCQSHK